MKRYLLLICLTVSISTIYTKPAASRYEEDVPWYLNYKKAAFTGTIIGFTMIPMHQISSIVLSKIKRIFPDIPETVVLYPVSGMLAACFLVATLKALDPYRNREREKKKALL